MAKLIQHQITTGVRIVLEINEVEARALEAIFSYGTEAFLETFYQKMGRSYLAPFEDGVRSLHDTIRDQLGTPLERLKRAHATLKEVFAKPTTNPEPHAEA